MAVVNTYVTTRSAATTADVKMDSNLQRTEEIVKVSEFDRTLFLSLPSHVDLD